MSTEVYDKMIYKNDDLVKSNDMIRLCVCSRSYLSIDVFNP